MMVNRNIKHCLLTRFQYENQNLFEKRLEIMVDILIPRLLNQTNKNFDWIIACKKHHENIIQSKYPNKIIFVRDSVEFKNLVNNQKYDIQTRHDSDDLMCLNYIDLIQKDFINNSSLDHPFLIDFQPTKYTVSDGKYYKMKLQYKEQNSNSPFISVCPQNTSMTIWDRAHTSWFGYVKTIIRNKTSNCVSLTCHQNNTTTGIQKGDVEIKNDKFSVIIPTMWKSKILEKTLSEMINSKLIDEIILIDNNTKEKINLPGSNKIKYIPQKENIFVNPAWNLGVSLVKNNNIIISNDDVCINQIDAALDKFNKINFDLIGFDIHNSNKSNQIFLEKIPHNLKRPNGFGSFFILKKNKYIKIPDGINIWYGDDIQYYGIENKYIFTVPSVSYELGKTVKSSSEFKDVIDSEDRPNYKNYLSSLNN